MPFSISLLRRWFAAAAVVVVLAVAGTYFVARHKVQNALKQVPGKMGIEIQQSANGFTISKSEQGRTLFKMEASKAVQFKLGGRTELHNVRITVYGRDSDRFDQLFGDDFEYDPHTGDAVAKGEVNIQLNANPGGTTQSDQAVPNGLKNPIHLKTSGLVFNQKTGNAYTREQIEFELPQGRGSARGFTYSASDNMLSLDSDVRINLTGENPATITAAKGSIRKEPRVILLDRPHFQSATQVSQAEKAEMRLRADNTIETVHADGGVKIAEREGQEGKVQSAKLESNKLDLMVEDSGDLLRSANFSGDVKFEGSGAQSVHGKAGRVLVNFGSKNQVNKMHADRSVQLTMAADTASSANAQDTELVSPAMDVILADGQHIKRAETSGAARITIKPASVVKGEQTTVTAQKFVAEFGDDGQVTSLHGAPEVRIVSQNPGQQDRVSSSESVNASFLNGVLNEITQAGSVTYFDGERKAFADVGRYQPTSQLLTLEGSPRIVDGGMTTTARLLSFNRTTGDASAEGNVKTTYGGLKSQPGGAMLASSSPIHVTARTMTAHQKSSTALYSGDVRLWQDANVVTGPTIEFDRDNRSLVAKGTKGQLISTVLFQSSSNGKAGPISISSLILNYDDRQRQATFEGGVRAAASELTIASDKMTAFLTPRGQDSLAQGASSSGKIDRIVSEGSVVITQPNRHATGNKLVYTVSDDTFVLTGGPPSIFDAEHGKITGVSLTLNRRDDRVLVKGDPATPALTQTRVAR
jgi:lipopolysaccharide export system protein LptA